MLYLTCPGRSAGFYPDSEVDLAEEGYPNVVFWARGRGLPSNLNVDPGHLLMSAAQPPIHPSILGDK